MVKITNIFGDSYSGQAGKAGVFAKWKGRQYRRAYVIPSNPNTTKQQSVRTNLSNAIDRWHEYQTEQRRAYGYMSAGLVMSGFNLFVSRWQKEMPDFKKIFRAAFSADGKFIYARGTDSTLLVLKADSGEEMHRLLPVKENKSTYRIMPVQAVEVSHDGSFVAAAVVSTVYIWDTKTVKILGSLGSGQKILSSTAISPDSKLLATSNMRQGGKIIIQRIPR